MEGSMNIVSWNVNGIRAAHGHGFLDWLSASSPDLLCLQETKAEPAQLPDDLLHAVTADGACYHAFWSSAKKRGYSGTAIYSKVKPLDVRPLGVSEFDDEGRVTIAEFDAFSLISAYFPNSQDGGARLSYKLDFCAAIMEHCRKLEQAGRHFVLSGDYNIAHRPIDLAHPRENEGSAGYLPEERAWMDAWVAAGFVDTFRYFCPDKEAAYTWWSYRMNARAHNVGWRLDYHCVDGAFMGAVKASRILADVTGSDHCPVEIELL
jgi:exodeoxyribonuclease-3